MKNQILITFRESIESLFDLNNTVMNHNCIEPYLRDGYIIKYVSTVSVNNNEDKLLITVLFEK